MERRTTLILIAVIVIIASGTLMTRYLYSNVEIFDSMTVQERQEKIQKFDENSIEIQELKKDPGNYLNQTVYLKGVPDISILQEDRYIIYPLLNRSQKIYVDGCEDFPLSADRVYLKGVFLEMDSKEFVGDPYENMSEEEINAIKGAREGEKLLCS